VSTWSAGNLLDRLREVLQDARGSLRTIASGTYLGNLPPGLEANEEARRALATLTSGAGVPTESRVVSVKRSSASPPVLGNLALYDIEVEVRQVFPFVTLTKLDDTTRDAVQGLAASSADIIAQALSFPGNLLTKQNGASTGLVSGMLAFVGSDYAWAGTVNPPGGTLTAVHKFKGVVKSAPATT
jgi:hypothetical protein